METKKKIIIFLQAGIGGAERMSVTIGKMLDKNKYDIAFCIIPKGDTRNDISAFIPNEYSIIRLKSGNPLLIIFRIFKTIIKYKPNIIFSSILYLNAKILLLRPLFPKIKFIIRCENYLFTFSKKQHFLIKATYNKSDAIIAQNQEMKDELVDQMNIKASKVYSLENPIDIETINQKVNCCESPYENDGKKHIVASGRFSYQKGFDLLVESFAEILYKGVNADLFILGAKDGNNKKEYEKVWNLVERHNITDRVHCLGFTNNPYPYIKFADCFVLSSRWEGLPNVLIEALYLGTPSAAFRCIPIIERIIDNGVTGFLAEKEDISSLQESITKCFNLGRICTKYKGASKEDFTSIFDNI